MKRFETIRDINTEVDEGKLLIATLGMLSSTEECKHIHPDNILHKILVLAQSIFEQVEPEEEVRVPYKTRF